MAGIGALAQGIDRGLAARDEAEQQEAINAIRRGTLAVQEKQAALQERQLDSQLAQQEDEERQSQIAKMVDGIDALTESVSQARANNKLTPELEQAARASLDKLAGKITELGGDGDVHATRFDAALTGTLTAQEAAQQSGEAAAIEADAQTPALAAQAAAVSGAREGAKLDAQLARADEVAAATAKEAGLAAEARAEAEARYAAQVPAVADFKDTQSLRKEFSKQLESFKEIDSKWQNIQRQFENPNPSNDLALIIDVAKMLDPGSVVREGEVRMQQASAGIVSKIQSLVNSAKGEGSLSDKQRSELFGLARHRFQVAQKQAIQTRGEFERIAQANNIPFDQVDLSGLGGQTRTSDVLTFDAEGNPVNG